MHFSRRFFRWVIPGVALALGLALGWPAFADAPADSNGPTSTRVSASYAVSAQGLPGGSTWTLTQQGLLGATWQWDSGLTISGQVSVPYDNSALEADNAVQQLAISWSDPDWLTVTLGKQVISWSVGRTFSALDNLTVPPDPLAILPVVSGQSGAVVDLGHDQGLKFSAVALPTTQPQNTTAAARLMWQDDWGSVALGDVHTQVGGSESEYGWANATVRLDPVTAFVEAQTLVVGTPGVRAYGGLDWSFPWLDNKTADLTGEYLYVTADGQGLLNTGNDNNVALTVSGLALSDTVSFGGSVLSPVDNSWYVSQVMMNYQPLTAVVVQLAWSHSGSWNQTDASAQGAAGFTDRVVLTASAQY